MAKVARQQEAEKEPGRSLELIANLARLFWDDVAERIGVLVKTLIEEFLEARRTEVLGAFLRAHPVPQAATGEARTSAASRPGGGRSSSGSPGSPAAPTSCGVVDRWGRRRVELDDTASGTRSPPASGRTRPPWPGACGPSGRLRPGGRPWPRSRPWRRCGGRKRSGPAGPSSGTSTSACPASTPQRRTTRRSGRRMPWSEPSGRCGAGPGRWACTSTPDRPTGSCSG